MTKIECKACLLLENNSSSDTVSETCWLNACSGVSGVGTPPLSGLLQFVHVIMKAMPEAVAHWSLTTLREKLIKIGAKVVRHGRYITFQMAEVTISRPLFAEILRLIDGLRPAPLPP